MISTYLKVRLNRNGIFLKMRMNELMKKYPNMTT